MQGGFREKIEIHQLNLKGDRKLRGIYQWQRALSAWLFTAQAPTKQHCCEGFQKTLAHS